MGGQQPPRGQDCSHHEDRAREGDLLLLLLLLLLLYDPFLKVRSRDPAMGLLAQAGGQTVVEYLTSKYHLMEVSTSPARGGVLRSVADPSSRAGSPGGGD